MRLGPEQPSVIPLTNHVRRNFIAANYAGAAGPVDTDDGSSYLHTEGNFLTFGGGIKSQWYGHSMNTTDSVASQATLTMSSYSRSASRPRC